MRGYSYPRTSRDDRQAYADGLPGLSLLVKQDGNVLRHPWVWSEVGQAARIAVTDDNYARLYAHTGSWPTRTRCFQALVHWLAIQPEISCVLLDLAMPGLSGEEALCRIRQCGPGLSVIIASSYSAQEVRERLSEQPVLAVLQKPCTLAVLREVMQNVCDKGPRYLCCEH